MDPHRLRVIVYRAFAEEGRPPGPVDLRRRWGMTRQELRAGLSELAAQRHLVLDADGNVVMAHPFSAVPLGFAVMGSRTLWWGGCAWDAFALPQLLPGEAEVLVATRCPACRRPHAWNVGTRTPPAGEQVAHFLVPVARMWDDVVHTCAQQRIFCSPDCVDGWLARTGNARGYVMTLETLWRLAEHWYDGCLDDDYVWRDPAAAADYFAAVGLTGPFWGL